MQYNPLYEQIMNDISKLVQYHINEAYDNALLEKYNAQDLFKDIMRETNKDTKIVIKQIQKLLIFIINKLQETNQYKKAEKIVDEYKKRVNNYIQDHKKITPRRLLKIIVTVLTIYGGVSLVQDCKNIIKQIQSNVETLEVKNSDDTYIDDEIKVDTIDFNNTFTDNIEPLKSEKNLDSEEVKQSYNKEELPSYIYNNDKNYQFTSTDKAREFIKKHEMLLLYPYYANEKEQKEGKVTIAYGHVVLPSDGELYTKILQLKKQGKIKLSFIYDKKQKKTILNPNHCKNLITKALADRLFLKDIKIAENRAYKAIKSMETDPNVKCYMLYNQKIKDGLTSLCYNAGNLKQDKYSFITKGLANCRFDYDNKCINKGDYNVSFSYFKKIKDNPNRRTQEYNLFFLSANKPLDNNKI